MNKETVSWKWGRSGKCQGSTLFALPCQESSVPFCPCAVITGVKNNKAKVVWSENLTKGIFYEIIVNASGMCSHVQ